MQDPSIQEEHDDLNDLNLLESGFYNKGYEAGFDHGKAHGIFEGRALGQEKGFEIFEELGYYAGTAQFWQAIAEQDEKKRKGLAQARQMLDLIDQFPTANNSSDVDTDAGTDIEALLQAIRSKYKIMCSAFGVRPRLQKAGLSM